MLVRRSIVERHDRPNAIGVEFDTRRCVGNVRNDFEGTPQPGRPRQGNAVAPEVESFAGVAGVENRHMHVGEQSRRGRRKARRFRVRIVTDEGHNATQGRRSGEHRVAQCVGCPIHTRCLAVPNADNPVVDGVGLGGRKLGTHHGGRCVLLVQALGELDWKIFHVSGCCFDGLAVAAKWRALIARDERRSLVTSSSVGAELFSWQARQRVDPGEEDVALVLHISVGEVVVEYRHEYAVREVGVPPLKNMFAGTAIVANIIRKQFP